MTRDPTMFDHHSAEFAKAPFDVSAEVRETCPVAWTPAHGGYWVLTRHDVVAEAFRDYETFSSASGATIPDLSFGSTHIPVTVDPPDLLMYRRFLTPWFSKEAVGRRTESIRSLLRALVGGLVEKREWDVVRDLADVVPGTVMCMILGLDPARRDAFAAAMERGMSNQGSTDPAVQEQLARDRGWLADQLMIEIQQRRRQPAEDFLSYLVREPIATDRLLTDREILDIVMVLFVAGFHTTSGALSSILVHLERHPQDRARLEREPQLIPRAVDELVRVYAPATAMARTLTRDAQFGGVSMSAGDKALLLIMSANRDPRRFTDPDTVDLDRDERGSVAFGWGVHRCLGLHLARIILTLEVETLFELAPGYRIDLDRVTLSDEMGIGYVHTSVPARLPG